jgi:hypothetical protein
MEMDRVPLWRGDHVAVKQLIEDFASYLYLPRLKAPTVLLDAARDGIELMLWMQESFAYADSYDAVTARYRGLRGGQHIGLSESNQAGLLVRSDVAQKQLEAEAKPPVIVSPPGGGTQPPIIDTGGITPPPIVDPKPKPTPVTGPKRYHGTVTLDATRVGRDAGRIGEEIIAHLAGLSGAKVTVTLEIEAEIPAGAPENVVRTVTENGRTLKFTNQGFEGE